MMVPKLYLEKWIDKAPWQTLDMVEQDLIISRVLIELYNNPTISESLVFRGGTALNKLYFSPPMRFSEDIDLVQIREGGIGSTIDAIRSSLYSFLGEPKRKITEQSVKLIYKYESINNLLTKLKVEINTTEHLYVRPLKEVEFSMNTEWFSDRTKIVTFCLEELMASKLRALYQRRKGRDLFDLWWVLENRLIDVDATIDIFDKYCIHSNEVITRALFEQNFENKQAHTDFSSDMNNLLATGSGWNFDYAALKIKSEIFPRLRGETWKGRSNKA